MTTRTTTRRSLLTGAVAVPVLVLAGAASKAKTPGPESVDPIFNAIAAHRSAEMEYSAALNAQADLEEALPKSVKRDGRVCVGPRGYFCVSHEQIDAIFSGRTAALSRSTVEAQRKKAHVAFDRDCMRQKAKQDARGWTAVSERVDRAGDNVTTTAVALTQIAPTSITGIAALMQYAVEFIDDGREWPNNSENFEGLDGAGEYKEWNYHLHRTVAVALEKIAMQRGAA